MTHYNYIIIGSGGGGKIARAAAAAGFSVAIIEKDRLGGTCLNRGCIPSKMLIHPADVMEEINQAKKYNIIVGAPHINFGKLTSEISDSVYGTSDNIQKKYEAGNVKNLTSYHGTATFINNSTININGSQITGDKIFIATGSRPALPPIKGLDQIPYMTSSEALTADTLPKKLIVIGGGIIAVELGGAYAAMGSEVHFIIRSEILTPVDNEITDEFVRAFEKKVHMHTNTDIKSIKYDEIKKEYTLNYIQNNTELQISSDGLLVATGVVPNSDTLGLENSNIELNKKGYINVDQYLETSQKNIYSLGDVIGKYQFRHSVNFEAEYLIDQLIDNISHVESITYPPMPWAIFSNPQISGVGYTEEELQKKSIPYFKGVNSYKDSAMGDALKSEYGLTKLLFQKDSQKLIGAHIVGVEASNMIHMLIVYIQFGATLTDILNTIYVHPALPENVRNAARLAKKNR